MASCSSRRTRQHDDVRILVCCVLFVLEVGGTRDVSFGKNIESNSNNRLPNEEELPTAYMLDNCKTWRNQNARINDHDVPINGATLVDLAPPSKATFALECVVTFRARKPSQRLLLHFEKLDINYNPGTVDRLHVYDGSDSKYSHQLTPNRGLYGKYYKGVYEFSSGGIHDYKSTGPSLTLYFEGSPSPDYSGFRVLLTVFTDVYKNGSCDAGQFKCLWSEICIPAVFQCSGYQNCGEGDRSNLEHCHDAHRPNYHRPNESTTDLGLMVGCAISIVILTVVLIWLGIICLKRSKLGRQRRRYVRHAPGPNEVEGSVVEPVQPRHFLAPILSYFEPPPIYSESNPELQCGATPALSPRFEAPPPYSVDERDTASLVRNEAEPSSEFTSMGQYLRTPMQQVHSNGHRILSRLADGMAPPTYDYSEQHHPDNLNDFDDDSVTFVLNAVEVNGHGSNHVPTDAVEEVGEVGCNDDAEYKDEEGSDGEADVATVYSSSDYPEQENSPHDTVAANSHGLKMLTNQTKLQPNDV